jgi:hypothetical protein
VHASAQSTIGRGDHSSTLDEGPALAGPKDEEELARHDLAALEALGETLSRLAHPDADAGKVER